MAKKRYSVVTRGSNGKAAAIAENVTIEQANATVANFRLDLDRIGVDHMYCIVPAYDVAMYGPETVLAKCEETHGYCSWANIKAAQDKWWAEDEKRYLAKWSNS